LAELTRRCQDFIGIELDPQFHRVACARLSGYAARQAQYVDLDRQALVSVAEEAIA